MPRNPVRLTCDDFYDDMSHCCGTCHMDQEYHGYGMCEVYPPGRTHTWAYVCCQVADTLRNYSRAQWAAALKRKRQRCTLLQ